VKERKTSLKDRLASVSKSEEMEGIEKPPLAPRVVDELREAQKTKIIKTLEAIIGWLNLNQDVLEDDTIKMIDERLQSHAKKSQIFMIVAIQNRMAQLLRWMEASDILEERLLDPEVVKYMEPGDLRKSLELLEKKIDNTFKQISDMIEQSAVLPKAFEDDELQKQKRMIKDGEEVFKDPAVRERTREKLSDMLSQMKKNVTGETK